MCWFFTIKTIIAALTRTSQGNPKRLGPCLKLSDSTTKNTAQPFQDWLEALWLESGTHFTQESLCLCPVPECEKGLWVSVGRIYLQTFLCVAGT